MQFFVTVTKGQRQPAKKYRAQIRVSCKIIFFYSKTKPSNEFGCLCCHGHMYGDRHEESRILIYISIHFELDHMDPLWSRGLLSIQTRTELAIYYSQRHRICKEQNPALYLVELLMVGDFPLL